MWRQECDCTRSKNQRIQYHLLQILSHTNSKQAACRVKYQSHYWLRCTDKIFPQLSLTCSGWNYNEQLNMVVPVWFDEPKFPLSIIRKKEYTSQWL